MSGSTPNLPPHIRMRLELREMAHDINKMVILHEGELDDAIKESIQEAMSSGVRVELDKLVKAELEATMRSVVNAVCWDMRETLAPLVQQAIVASLKRISEGKSK